MFSLSKELKEYRAKNREYNRKVVKEYAKRIDETNDGGDKIVKDLGEMGLLGIKQPTKYGGLELGEMAFAIATEELET